MTRPTAAALIASWWVMLGAPAMGDVDLTGRWQVVGFADFCLDIVQTGTTLSTINCGGAIIVFGPGPIDPMTGVFTLTGGSQYFCPPPPLPPDCIVCGPAELSATASPDGLTFAGTMVIPYIQFPGNCILLDYPTAGARVVCGDGEVQLGEQCDDGNTIDGDCCSSTCQYESPGSACTQGGSACASGTCDDAGVCVLPVCKSAGAANLLIRSGAGGKDRWVWKWRRGPLTTQADFGDPSSDTDYAFCLYAGTTVAEIAIPADAAKWRSTARGYRYGDAAGAAGGITTITLKSGDGTAKVILRGKGPNLPDPMLGDLSAPVTARLRRSDEAVCFESVFTAADITKQRPTLFKAKLR